MVVTTLSSTDLCCKQLENDTTGPILQAKEADRKQVAETLRSYPRAARQLFQLWDQLVVVDGVLNRKFEETEPSSIDSTQQHEGNSTRRVSCR